MWYKIRALAAASLFLFISGSIFAQAPRELRFGNWVSANLRQGDEHLYNVRAPGNGIIIVETSGDMDTYLEVYDDYDELIAENDDWDDYDYNAKVEIFVNAGENYLVLLRGYDEDESGPYQIRATFENVPPDADQNTARSRAIPLKLGESMPVYFRTMSESRWYSFNMPGTATTFIVQTRGSLDTVLVLYNAQGGIIEEDDDSGESRNARISQRLAPGTVYIEVKEYAGLMGRCTLHAEIR